MPDKDYSAVPLTKKLGIAPNSRILVVNEPDNFVDVLAPLPDNVQWLSENDDVRDLLDVVILFVTQEIELRDRFTKLAARLASAGGLWVAYPKKSAKVHTDLVFENVQRIGLDAGLVDNKTCAINTTYTGLRFVIRLKDRAKP